MLFSDIYAGPIISALPDNLLLVYTVNELLLFVPPVTVYFLLARPDIKQTFSLKNLSAANIFLIVLISIMIQPFLMSVSAVSSLFFPNRASDFLQSMADVPALSTLIITSLMPAVFEEMYFRGIVFSNFKSMGAVKACVLGGLLFGMAHLNFQQFSYAFIMGIIFCYFVYMTGSIFSSALSHFLINSIQTILSAFAMKALPAEQLQAQSQQVTFADIMPFIYFSVLSLIPLIGMFFVFHKYNTNSRNILVTPAESAANDDLFKKDSFFNWPLLAFTAVFLYYGISSM